MERWKKNTLFVVGVGSAVIIAFSQLFGFKIDIRDNPEAFMGVGMILTYVLSAKDDSSHHSRRIGRKKADEEEAKDNESSDT